MATYEIYKKDGTPVRVQGPPNLSFEQVLSIYEGDKPKQPSQSEQRAPVTLPEGFSEATWGDRAGELFKGIGGGALTFLEQGLEGTSQLFPEKQEQWLREKIGSGIGSLRDKYTQKDMWQEVALQNADAGFDVPWEDVIPRKFGEALGSFGGIGATALIPYAGVPAALALITAGGAEEQRDRAIAAGKLDELSVRDRLLGAGVGLSEMFAPFKAFKAGGGAKGISGWVERIRRAFTTGGIEGAQEASAQAAQNWIEQTGYNPQVDIREGTGEAAGYGTAVGMFTQGFLDLAIRSRGRPATTTVAEELERVTETPKLDDEVTTKAPGAPIAPIVGEEGQSEFDFGETAKAKRIKSKEAQAKALGVPTLTKKEVKRREKDSLGALPKEEQTETFSPDTNLGTRPQISEKEKYERIMKGVPESGLTKREMEGLEKLESEKAELEAKVEPKDKVVPIPTTKAQTIESIIKKQLQAREDGTPDIEAGRDGTRIEDSPPNAGGVRSDDINPQGIETPERDGLGDIGGDTRPDNVPKTKRKSALTKKGQNLLDIYNETGQYPVYNKVVAKTFADNGIDVKDNNGIPKAMNELIAKAKGEVQSEPELDFGTIPPETKEATPKEENLTKEATPKEENLTEEDFTEVDLPPPAETIDTSKVKTTEAQEILKSIMTPEDLEKAGIDLSPSALAEGIKAVESKIGTGILRAGRKRVQPIKVTEDKAKELDKKFKASKEKGELKSAIKGTLDSETYSENKKRIAELTKKVKGSLTKEEQQELETLRAENKAIDAEYKINTDTQKAVAGVQKKREEGKRKEAQEKLNEIYEKISKTKTGKAIKEFADRMDLNKPTPKSDETSFAHSIPARDITSIVSLISLSDYKIDKEAREGKGKLAWKLGGVKEKNQKLAAKRYFKKTTNVTGTIDIIIEDSLNVHEETKDQSQGATLLLSGAREPEEGYITGITSPLAEKSFYRYTSGENANDALTWIRENLSRETNEYIDKTLKTNKSEIASRYYGTTVITSKTASKVAADIVLRNKQTEANKALEEQLNQERGTSFAQGKQDYIEKAINPTWDKVIKGAQQSVLDNYGISGKNNISLATLNPNILKGNNEKITEFDRDFQRQMTGETKPRKATPKKGKSTPEKGKSTGKADPDILNKIYNGVGEKGLDESATLTLAMPMYSMAQKALRKGDLRSALSIISIKNVGSRNNQLARGFLKNIGTTKVEVVEDLKLEGSKRKVSGLFDPKTNTIKLDAVTGLNNHTLFHELSHAVTDARLSNLSDPLTKQVTMLFNLVKDRTDMFYGSQNIREFVAEANTNPLFRDELSRVYIKGTPYTAWDKLLYTVVNFIRKIFGLKSIDMGDFKKYTEFKSPVGELDITNVDEETSRLIAQIVTPASQYRNGSEQGMDAGAIIRDIQKVSKRSKEKKEPKTKLISDFTSWAKGTMSGSAKPTAAKAGLGFLDIQMVGDLLNYQDPDGKLGFEGRRMQRAVEQQEKDVNQRNERVEGTIQGVINRLKGKNITTIPSQRLEDFNYAVSMSTRWQVNPNHSRAKAEEITKKDPDRMKAWEMMQEPWKRLGKEGQEAYELLRLSYVNMFKELRNVVFSRIDGIENLNSGEKKSLKEEIYGKLFENATVDPYFPLVRSGSHWLSFKAKDPVTNNNEEVIMAFETAGARQQAIAKLKTEHGINAQAFVKEDAYDNVYSRAPSDSFMGKALNILDKRKVSPAVKNDLMNLFIESLPETSFAKSFQPREGTLGFSEDAIASAKIKGYSLGRQIEKLRNAPRIRREQDRLEKLRKEHTDGNEWTAQVIRELEDRGKHALNPPPDEWARAANRLAFTYTLGLNVSSAVVNLSQIPLFIYPYLGGKYGYGKSAKAIFDNYKILRNSGFKRKIRMGAKVGGKEFENVTAAPSMDNMYDMQEDGSYKVTDSVMNDPSLSKKFKDKLKSYETLVAVSASQNGRSLWFDSLGTEGVKRGTGILDRVSMYAAFLFHQVERFNRQIALTSSYSLELDRLNSNKATASEKNMSTKDKEVMAAEFAMANAQKMNGGALLVNAPRHAQKSIGRVAMMYKSYGIRMYSTMLQTVYDGVRAAKKASGSNDAEARREARIALKQSIGILGSSLILAGAQGLVLSKAFLAMADLILWSLGEDDESAESIVRGYLGEMWWKGPVSEMTGLDVSERIGLSSLLWRANPYRKEGDLPALAWELGLGPAGSVILQGHRSFKELVSAFEGEGDMRKALVGMTPTAIRNVDKALQYSETFGAGAIKSSRGDVIVNDPTTWELTWKSLGFNSTRHSFQQQKNEYIKGIDKTISESKSQILKRLNVTRRDADIEGYKKALRRMAKYNQKYPFNAITPLDMKRSMKRFNETTEDMVGSIYLNPRNKDALLYLVSDWDTGLNVFS